MWTSKIGNEGKAVRMGLTSAGALVTFSALSGPDGVGAPQLRLRLQYAAPDTAVSFALVAYTDTAVPAQYNAECPLGAAEFAALVPGVYIAEVAAQLGGEEILFPEAGHAKLRFLAAVQ